MRTAECGRRSRREVARTGRGMGRSTGLASLSSLSAPRRAGPPRDHCGGGGTRRVEDGRFSTSCHPATRAVGGASPCAPVRAGSPRTTRATRTSRTRTGRRRHALGRPSRPHTAGRAERKGFEKNSIYIYGGVRDVHKPNGRRPGSVFGGAGQTVCAEGPGRSEPYAGGAGDKPGNTMFV